MDHTVPKSEIEKVLRDFDRKKNEETVTESNSRSRDIVSSIGTESTLTVLMDIRKVMCDMESSIATLNDNIGMMMAFMRNESTKQQERHEQILAFMHNIGNKLEPSLQPRASMSVSDMSMMSPAPTKQTYYFRGDEIKNPESLVGCILMQVEQHASRLVDIEPTFSDTTITEMSQWGSAIRVLKGKDSDKLSIMPLSSFECSTALEIVASPVKGRPVTCRIEHIDELHNKCPSLMGQVEEFRKRLMRCPGIINTRKMLALAQLNYPYVSTEGVLNIRNESSGVKVSQIVVNLVKSLNQIQRGKYVAYILAGDKPIVAANKASQKD